MEVERRDAIIPPSYVRTVSERGCVCVALCGMGEASQKRHSQALVATMENDQASTVTRRRVER